MDLQALRDARLRFLSKPITADGKEDSSANVASVASLESNVVEPSIYGDDSLQNQDLEDESAQVSCQGESQDNDEIDEFLNDLKAGILNELAVIKIELKEVRATCEQIKDTPNQDKSAHSVKTYSYKPSPLSLKSSLPLTYKPAKLSKKKYQCGRCHNFCDSNMSLMDPCGHHPYCSACIDELSTQKEATPLFMRDDLFDYYKLKCPKCMNHVKSVWLVHPVKSNDPVNEM